MNAIRFHPLPRAILANQSLKAGWWYGRKRTVEL